MRECCLELRLSSPEICLHAAVQKCKTGGRPHLSHIHAHQAYIDSTLHTHYAIPLSPLSRIQAICNTFLKGLEGRGIRACRTRAPGTTGQKYALQPTLYPDRIHYTRVRSITESTGLELNCFLDSQPGSRNIGHRFTILQTHQDESSRIFPRYKPLGQPSPTSNKCQTQCYSHLPGPVDRSIPPVIL